MTVLNYAPHATRDAQALRQMTRYQLADTLKRMKWSGHSDHDLMEVYLLWIRELAWV